MKSLLLFLAGLLVGANLVYFVMRSRAPAAPVPATQAASSTSAPSLPVARPTQPQPPPRATPDVARDTPSTPSTVESDALLLPVLGIKPGQLHNTFKDSRGGGSRVHEALDIMAPKGTPVVAAADGKVVKLFTSKPGGLTVYQFDPSEKYAYYYAHLDRYADGLQEGMVLKRGDVLGYVGVTGNSDPNAPHLHFAVVELTPEKQWWKGTPLNPFPLLKD